MGGHRLVSGGRSGSGLRAEVVGDPVGDRRFGALGRFLDRDQPVDLALEAGLPFADVELLVELDDQLLGLGQFRVVEGERRGGLGRLDGPQTSFQLLDLHFEILLGGQHRVELLLVGRHRLLPGRQDLHVTLQRVLRHLVLLEPFFEVLADIVGRVRVAGVNKLAPSGIEVVPQRQDRLLLRTQPVASPLDFLGLVIDIDLGRGDHVHHVADVRDQVLDFRSSSLDLEFQRNFRFHRIANCPTPGRSVTESVTPEDEGPQGH